MVLEVLFVRSLLGVTLGHDRFTVGGYKCTVLCS